MGEEEKKPAAAAVEEKKMEEKKPEEPKKAEEEKTEKPVKPAEEKKEEKKTEESKDEKSPPPPQEIVLKVYMHCEGCARKVRRSLKGFEGVEDVTTDCKTHKVVVKGEKADPLKVLERVQRKSHRQVELLSPIPKPPTEEDKKAKEEEKPKPEEKKEEPQVITVVLKVYMHCEACALEIKKRIQRMKGVESAEPDLKSSQVTVKGVFEPQKLVEYVHKRTGKHASIVKTEPAAAENKEGEKGKESKDEKKADEGQKEKKAEGGGGEESKDKKEGGEGDGKAEAAAAEDTATEETKVVEVKANPYYYYPPRYAMELYAYPPPQMFSDENPNACSVM
ncbi:microtubule-associated protein 1B-like [Tripterygium wilfordii]|uniref:Microtubule-associated protein 1B-like n=1 Tax=Tripterygium wilfordii TaxID=458696 RepID=A0A7J7CAL4_TRIWF|nr:heavy metal-associated isoprenylated plant protein 7-like [Tripterygium wilfordii]KAF5730965.1 microtubule-associated protein 1B-like [Tripterygium wilfordii]